MVLKDQKGPDTAILATDLSSGPGFSDTQSYVELPPRPLDPLPCYPGQVFFSTIIDGVVNSRRWVGGAQGPCHARHQGEPINASHTMQ